MSLLFEQNLSRRLPALLAAEFLGAEQVPLARLAAADDRAVWEYAALHGSAVGSKDSLRPRVGFPQPSPKVRVAAVGQRPDASGRGAYGHERFERLDSRLVQPFVSLRVEVGFTRASGVGISRAVTTNTSSAGCRAD